MATHVIITDAVPVGQLTNVSYSVNSGVTITDIGADPQYAWEVAPLSPGAGGVITLIGVLSADLPYGTVVTNTATITAASDANPANNASSVVYHGGCTD